MRRYWGLGLQFMEFGGVGGVIQFITGPKVTQVRAVFTL